MHAAALPTEPVHFCPPAPSTQTESGARVPAGQHMPGDMEVTGCDGPGALPHGCCHALLGAAWLGLGLVWLGWGRLGRAGLAASGPAVWRRAGLAGRMRKCRHAASARCTQSSCSCPSPHSAASPRRLSVCFRCGAGSAGHAGGARRRHPVPNSEPEAVHMAAGGSD